MENGDNDTGNITDSFLTASGQYIVHTEGTEGEDGLGIAGDGSDQGDSQKDSEPLREQDRFLPIANVARIMKNAIPKSGKASCLPSAFLLDDFQTHTCLTLPFPFADSQRCEGVCSRMRFRVCQFHHQRVSFFFPTG
ncbi:unnamed protein product [Ixodes hexagonus]